MSDLTDSQANRAYDDSPQRFREKHPEDRFSGASGELFEQAMAQTRMAICLCDPRLPDLPIVYANRSFRDLTGYEEDEIIGRNCRFLQGPATDPAAVQKIRNALVREDVVVVELLNYRKDRKPFWNALHLGPIYDLDGKLMYFFGSQWDVSDVHAARADEQLARELARELSHRMKNMFSVIGGIVSITGRARGVPAEAREINERIQALGRAYETTLDDSSRGSIEVGKAISSVLSPYNFAGQITLKGNGLRCDFAAVSALGLTLHELAVNATKYGALRTETGAVEVSWQRENTAAGPIAQVSWIEQGGPAIKAAPDGSTGTGIGIINRILEMADANIERDWRPDGLAATINLPLGNEA